MSSSNEVVDVMDETYTLREQKLAAAANSHKVNPVSGNNEFNTSELKQLKKSALNQLEHLLVENSSLAKDLQPIYSLVESQSRVMNNLEAKYRVSENVKKALEKNVTELTQNKQNLTWLNSKSETKLRQLEVQLAELRDQSNPLQNRLSGLEEKDCVEHKKLEKKIEELIARNAQLQNEVQNFSEFNEQSEALPGRVRFLESQLTETRRSSQKIRFELEKELSSLSLKLSSDRVKLEKQVAVLTNINKTLIDEAKELNTVDK